MIQSTGGCPMASKAAGTLVLIIDKKHASWGLMVSASFALELRFRRRLRIASTRPLVGHLCPCTRVVVHCCVELANGLPLAYIPPSGLLGLGWQQLNTYLMDFSADWPHTVPRWRPGRPGACIEHCDGRASGGLRCQNETCSLHQSHSVFSYICAARPEAMVAIAQAVVYD